MTGRRWKGLADFVIRHDLVLVVDQAFEDFTFGNEMLSPAALPGMFERTVTVFSFSKGMGLSGLRVGYIVCDDRIMDAMYANAVAVIGGHLHLGPAGDAGGAGPPGIHAAVCRCLRPPPQTGV